MPVMSVGMQMWLFWIAATDRTGLARALRTLKLSGMRDTLDARLAQARAGELGRLEFLQVLCEDRSPAAAASPSPEGSAGPGSSSRQPWMAPTSSQLGETPTRIPPVDPARRLLGLPGKQGLTAPQRPYSDAMSC